MSLRVLFQASLTASALVAVALVVFSFGYWGLPWAPLVVIGSAAFALCAVFLWWR